MEMIRDNKKPLILFLTAARLWCWWLFNLLSVVVHFAAFNTVSLVFSALLA